MEKISRWIVRRCVNFVVVRHNRWTRFAGLRLVELPTATELAIIKAIQNEGWVSIKIGRQPIPIVEIDNNSCVVYRLRHKICYEPQRFYSRAKPAFFDTVFSPCSVPFVSSSRQKDRKRHKCYPIGTYLARLLFPFVRTSIRLRAPFTCSTFAAKNIARSSSLVTTYYSLLSPVNRQCISHFFTRVGILMTCGWRSGAVYSLVFPTLYRYLCFS